MPVNEPQTRSRGHAVWRATPQMRAAGQATTQRRRSAPTSCASQGLKMHFPITRRHHLAARGRPGARRGRRWTSPCARAKRSGWWASRAAASPPRAAPSCSSTSPPRASLLRRHGPDHAARRSNCASMRRQMQMIFQDPYASLNPRMTVGTIIGEPLEVHGLAKRQGRGRSACRSCCAWWASTRTYVNRYPHEFSGGQRQRIGIARALAVQPELHRLPTSRSRPSTCRSSAQVINLLEELQAEFDLTYLFIAHDLSVVRHISDRVAVMYLGKIVELADRARAVPEPAAPLHQGAALGRAHPRPDGRDRSASASS